VNQTPPPPLVHERRPRGSRRCTELELNVVVVHGTSRNPMITKRAVVHETRLLRGFANRTAGRAFRFAAAEEPTELNSWLSYNIQRSQSQRRTARGDYRGGKKPNSTSAHVRVCSFGGTARVAVFSRLKTRALVAGAVLVYLVW